MTKQALGPLKYGTTVQPWGRGAAAGGFVFLSGIDGVTDEHGRPAHGVAAQTLVTLNRVHRLLADAGADFEDIVQFDQFLADPAERAEYMRVRDGWLAEHAPKLLSERSYASLLIYPALATPEMRVEIRAVAYLGA
ncbi:RidA family protein [Amycolatopsis circi]|uniref:RidA family protein n=1 Tax=Amycolatopsis circi TaxID=871959 RepID=UPI0013BE8DCE|nr:RidA family protein [Amycolatopsis circi]